jgi:hypothetical protein
MAEQETSYALSDLVKRRRAELRLSLRKFAETCIDPETGIQEIKHAWVERLEKRQNVTPLHSRSSARCGPASRSPWETFRTQRVSSSSGSSAETRTPRETSACS